MKIGENTEIKIDLKTVVKLIVITAVFVGMYYTIEADIQLQENHIKVLKEDIEHVEDHLDELQRDFSTLKPKRK